MTTETLTSTRVARLQKEIHKGRLRLQYYRRQKRQEAVKEEIAYITTLQRELRTCLECLQLMRSPESQGSGSTPSESVSTKPAEGSTLQDQPVISLAL